MPDLLRPVTRTFRARARRPGVSLAASVTLALGTRQACAGTGCHGRIQGALVLLWAAAAAPLTAQRRPASELSPPVRAFRDALPPGAARALPRLYGAADGGSPLAGWPGPAPRVDTTGFGDIFVRSAAGSAAGLAVGLLVVAGGDFGAAECGHDDCIDTVAGLGLVLSVVGPVVGAAIGARSAEGRQTRTLGGSVLGFFVGAGAAVAAGALAGPVPAYLSFSLGQGLITAAVVRSSAPRSEGGTVLLWR